MLRQPVVAGSFYPADKARLAAMLDGFLVSDREIPGVVAAVVPHAGYIYSGIAAGALFAAIDIPETVLILCPNHSGYGHPYGVYDSGSWRTPLGDVPVDEKLAAAILKDVPFAKSDTLSHAREHSLEVDLPFLQRRRGDVKIVPICIGEHNYPRLVKLGEGIAAAVRASGVETLILASSDMTHHETAESAARKDNMAIERMLAMDEEGLWLTVERHDITMCGVAPAVAAIAAARVLGAVEGRLVKYTTSADYTGDASDVVAYASVAFTREGQ